MSAFDPAQVAYRLLPIEPLVLHVSGTSSPFTPLNTTSSPIYYTFVNDVCEFVKRGGFNITAATSADFLLLPGEHDFVIPNGQGIRIVAAAATGSLYVGNTVRVG